MVGVAYINGTAEVVGRDGIVWLIAPISYNVGDVIGTKNIFKFSFSSLSNCN